MKIKAVTLLKSCVIGLFVFASGVGYAHDDLFNEHCYIMPDLTGANTQLGMPSGDYLKYVDFSATIGPDRSDCVPADDFGCTLRCSPPVVIDQSVKPSTHVHGGGFGCNLTAPRIVLTTKISFSDTYIVSTGSTSPRCRGL
jgi:hypothetical protein